MASRNEGGDDLATVRGPHMARAPNDGDFQLIADSIDQMIWTARPDGYHDYYNRRWYEYTGMAEGSTDGTGWNGMFHPDDRERAHSVWRQSLESGEPYQIEYRLRHHSGEYRWVLGRANPVRDSNGAILRWYGTCTDIHDFKLVEEALRESRARLDAVMENMPDVLFVKDRDGRYVEANRSFLLTLGRSADQVIGVTDADLFGGEIAEQFADEDRQVRVAGRPQRFEEVVDYGGRRLTFLTNKFPLGDGQVGGIASDITERKEAEEALRESEERLRVLADNLPLAVVYQVLTSRDMSERSYTFVSGNSGRITGVPAEDAMRDPSALMGLISDEELPLVLAAEQKAAASLSTVDIEINGSRRDGSELKARVIARPRQLPGGQLLWDGLIIDITERKRALEEAQRVATLLRAIGDATPDLMFAKDTDGRLTYGNAATAALLGREPDEIVGLGNDSLTSDPEEARALTETDRRILESGVAEVVQEALTSPDGTRRIFRSAKTPMRNAEGKVVGLAGVATDITERLAAEQALRESEARFRSVADSAPAPVWVTNEEGLEFANRALRDFMGPPYDEQLGTVWMKLAHPDDLPAVQASRAEGWAKQEPYTFECRFRRADGEWRLLRASCNPRFDRSGKLLGFVGLATDLTDARRAEHELRESEARFRAMADSAPAPVWVAGESGVEFVNRALLEFTGIDFTRIAGSGWKDIAHPDDIAGIEISRAHGWNRHVPYVFEGRFRRADGEWRVLQASCNPRLDGSGKFLGFVGIATDLTDVRKAEAELRQSEERLRVALSAGSLGDWSWDSETDLVSMSNEGAALFGIPPGRVLTWTEMQALIEAEDAKRAAAAVEKAIAKGTDYRVEYRVNRPDGRRVWVLAVGRPIYGPNGAPIGMIGAVQDVTARREAEEKLKQQSRNLETLNRTGAALAAELDLERLVQMVTDAGVELTGAAFGAFFYNVYNQAGEAFLLYTLSGADRSQFESFGMPRATAVFHPTFVGEGTIRSEDITKDPRYGRNDPHFGMPNGHLPVRSYLAVPVVSRSGEVIGGLFFGHPEPGRFSESHETLMSGIAAQAAIGIDNARLYQAAQKEVADRMRAEAELRQLNETLEQRVAEEVARRAEAEAALRQAQKMETLGQLTGGVAHDFNNLLQIVTGNLEILQRNLGDESPRLRRAADNAQRGAERAAMLTQRLLAFSRRQPLDPKPVDLNKLVGGMSELLHRTLGETIEVETVLSPGLWRVEADPNQLENAILNLAVNARDAMPGGGKLTIETANTHLDRSYVAQNAEVQPGQYIAICVSDTGAGMSEETVARAFEPFFTTKEVGKGTGLGLSMVYGFVKQSGGHLKIYSEVGEGTTVKIYLPRFYAEAEEEEEQPEQIVPEGTREETILVCEDDDDVRAYSVEVLRELGYRVLEAHDGPSALRLLERQEGRVDLLFTDVVLPSGMTGAVLAERARSLRPDLKVLFTTGYARNAIVHHGRLDPGVALITKPFSYSDLAARVRDILDAS